MKLSREWLSDFIDLSGISNEQLSDIVTTRIAEVEGVSQFVFDGSLASDFIIEIDNKSLTHRPDLWSHFGFAKELSAVLKRELKSGRDLETYSDDCESGSRALAQLKKESPIVGIRIAPLTKLRRMVCCVIENVAPVDSPLWMQVRLHAIGAGVRNFLVDLSNYVMHDCGQPNHFFDADKIVGDEIQIRNAQDNERITTLDGRERILSSEDLVIADKVKALDLGGIMGGAATSISEQTTRVLFTSGTWDPVIVRQSSTRNQARTDAAQRYEKNLSPYLPAICLQRTLELLFLTLPQARIRGGVADVFPAPPEPVRIFLSAALLAQRLGEGAPGFELGCGILSRLGMTVEDKSDDGAVIVIPHYRATKDLTIAEDLIEEIGRCHGYENISESTPFIATLPSGRPKLTVLEWEVRELLRGQGFSEISNYSFVTPEYSQRLGYQLEEGILLRNPIDETQGAMRTSLIPGMIQTVEANSRYSDQLMLFEIGRGYFNSKFIDGRELASKEKYRNVAAYERRMLAAALSSSVAPVTEFETEGGSEFYFLAGVVRRVILLRTDVRVIFRVHEAPFAWMHPGRSAEVMVGEIPLGYIAEARGEFIEQSPGRVVLAELDLDLLLECSVERHFKAISKFPPSFFELSIIAPKKEPYQHLEDLLREGTQPEFVRAIDLLTVYQGRPIPDGFKSVSVRITFGSLHRTVSKEELKLLQDNLMNYVKQRGYQIRE